MRSSIAKLLLSLFVALALVVGEPSARTPTEVAIETATRVARAIERNDGKTVIQLTYPRVFELIGVTRMQAIELYTAKMHEAKTEGVLIETMKLGRPSPIFREGNRSFIFIPYEARGRNPQDPVIVVAFLLGISEDGGMTWEFVDGFGLDSNTIKNFVPRYRGEPPLPRKTITAE